MKLLALIGAVAVMIVSVVVCPDYVRSEVSARMAPPVETVAEARDAFKRTLSAILRSAPDGLDEDEDADVATPV